MWVFTTRATSDLGLVRDGNEDAALVTPVLVAVADGMGGHVGGEVASRIAIMRLKSLKKLLDSPQDQVEARKDLLLNIGVEIDQGIAEHTKENPALVGMGTTLTALHLEGQTVELLHIGDSRCYRYRDNTLTQLSYDHTVMQELLDQGRLTPEEVFQHPQRSMLTQVLMGNSGIDPVLQIFPAQLGDRYLVCSDGLSGVISDTDIVEVIQSVPEADLLDALLNKTKERGAPDNITILWSQVTESSNAVDSELLLGAAHE